MKSKKRKLNRKNLKFHEEYMREEFQEMNPGPLERIQQELIALYTIPAAYFRDWWFVKRNQARSLMNRWHWRYTSPERQELLEKLKTRIRIALDWPLSED